MKRLRAKTSGRRQHGIPIAPPTPSGLSAGKHRPKTGVGQNAGDFHTLVTLNLDLSSLHRASGSTCLLDFCGESLFLSQTHAEKPTDDRHGLAAAVRGLAFDIHSPTVFLWHSGSGAGSIGTGPCRWNRRQSCALQCRKRTVPYERLITRGHSFFLAHTVNLFPYVDRVACINVRMPPKRFSRSSTQCARRSCRLPSTSVRLEWCSAGPSCVARAWTRHGCPPPAHLPPLD